jgi:hypothetical protein
MGFADPLALLFTALVGVLVALYLWERTRRAVVVPSLLLWRALREDVVRARRFRPDLLFFLQLLLLLALIAGLAKPYLYGGAEAAGARYVLLLDTSASMQAIEGRRTRFAQARDRALGFVDDLGSLDEVMLVEAGYLPQVVVDFTRRHADVAEALRRAAPTDTAGNLILAVEFADAFRKRSDIPAQIAVFTDLGREELPVALRDGVSVFQFGETDDNVGIESLQVFQGRFQDHRSARAHVTVENFSHGVKHGVLTVQLNDRVVDRKGFTLPPRESAAFLIPRLPGPGMVRASLDGSDALPADDAAYGWVRATSKRRVLLVSVPGSFVSDFHRVAASNAIEVVDARPDNFEVRMVDGFDLAIFHQFVPAEEPGGNALYVFPPDSEAVRVVGEVEDVEILDWDSRHPVLDAVQPQSSLPLRRARIVATPDWARPLLWARTAQREFALAFAGERGDRRTAFVAFDLDAERLLANDNLDLFLFFMNLIGWLLPSDAGAAVSNTGEAWAWEDMPGSELTVTDPREHRLVLPAAAKAMDLPFAGAYFVASGDQERIVLANFFDAVESDIGRAGRRAPSPELMRPARLRVEASAARRPLATWFLGLALVVFVIEWMLARRAQ